LPYSCRLAFLSPKFDNGAILIYAHLADMLWSVRPPDSDNRAPKPAGYEPGLLRQIRDWWRGRPASLTCLPSLFSRSGLLIYLSITVY